MYEYSQEEKDVIKRRHLRSLEDPVYSEGFSSTETENPYPYPSELCLAVRQIAHKAGKLSDEEKVELRRRRERFEETEWNRWSSGNHKRVFLKENSIL